MMISPEYFSVKYLKGKTTKTILKRLEETRKEIVALKNHIEKPTKEDLLVVECPSKETRLLMQRKYLEEIFKVLDRRKVKYELTEEERKSKDFNSKLSQIKKIELSVYGHCPFSNDLEVMFSGNEVSVSQSYLSRDKHSCYDKIVKEENEKEWIILKLKELYMGEWKEMYEPEDHIVNDGTNWQLTMEFTHPNETVIIRGNNAYPYNFDEFLSIFDAEHFIDEDAYREGFWNIK